jgi:GAF domain-containing protein
MAASSESVELLELFQIQQQAGPCWDAFPSRAPVVNADLAQDTNRWPQFAARSVDAGFRSVHAFPLRLRQETIGALNVFTSDTSGRLTRPCIHRRPGQRSLDSNGVQSRQT